LNILWSSFVWVFLQVCEWRRKWTYEKYEKTECDYCNKKEYHCLERWYSSPRTVVGFEPTASRVQCRNSARGTVSSRPTQSSISGKGNGQEVENKFTSKLLPKFILIGAGEIEDRRIFKYVVEEQRRGGTGSG
jgi:hypothetical protein